MDPRDSSPSRRISFFQMAPSDPPQTPRIYFFDVPSEGTFQNDAVLDVNTSPKPTGDTSTGSSTVSSQPTPDRDEFSLPSRVSVQPAPTEEIPAALSIVSSQPVPARAVPVGPSRVSDRPTPFEDTSTRLSGQFTEPGPVQDAAAAPSRVSVIPALPQDVSAILNGLPAYPTPARDAPGMLSRVSDQSAPIQDSPPVSRKGCTCQASVEDRSPLPSKASSQPAPIEDASPVPIKVSSQPMSVQGTPAVPSRASTQQENPALGMIASRPASIQGALPSPSKVSAEPVTTKDTSTLPSRACPQDVPTVPSRASAQDLSTVPSKVTAPPPSAQDTSTGPVLNKASSQPAPTDDTPFFSIKAPAQPEPAQDASTLPIRASPKDTSTGPSGIPPQPEPVQNAPPVLSKVSHQPAPIQDVPPTLSNVSSRSVQAQDTDKSTMPSRLFPEPAPTGRPRALSSGVPATQGSAESPPVMLTGARTAQTPAEKQPAILSGVPITQTIAGKPTAVFNENPDPPAHTTTPTPAPPPAPVPTPAQKTSLITSEPVQEPKPSITNSLGTSSIVAPSTADSSAPVARPPNTVSGYVKVAPGLSQISASSALSQAKSKAEDKARQANPLLSEKPLEKPVAQKDVSSKPDPLPRHDGFVSLDSEEPVEKNSFTKPDAIPRYSEFVSLGLNQPTEKPNVSSKPAPLPRSSRAAIIAVAKRLGEEKAAAKAVRRDDTEQSTDTKSDNGANVKGEDAAAAVKKTKAPERATEEPRSADAVKSDPAAGEKEIEPPAEDEKEGQNEPVEDGPPPPEDAPVPTVVEVPPEQPKKPQTPVMANRDWQTEDYKIEKGLGETDKHASQLTPEEWDQVLENCGVMYGWCIDRNKNRITRAPKPAFCLKTLPPPKQPLNPPSDQASPEKGASDDNVTLPEADRLPKPVKARPAFTVNDNSRIDVMVSAHEFETSMATNDFSSQCTEGSVSGGFGSFSATASASHSTSKSSASASSSSQYNKTMIAKFLFPRVDVFLHPSHLEPTPELEEALKNVRDKKNIVDLRKLQSDFGYLFCNRVTLGGRLQTLKIMDQKGEKSEQEQKQSFKTSVGVAVSSPYGGGSASHSKEGGSASSNSKLESQHNEQHVFEAIGGDTLLASNPTEWVTTVGKLKNWRVIDRDSLTLMVDAIADLPGLEQVKNWYRKAAPPKLKEYIEFAGTTDKQIRLRLLSPNHGLSCSYLKHDPNHNSPIPPAYYLGHGPYWAAMPRAMDIDRDDEWEKLMSGEETDLLFSPASYRAPAIYGYASNKVGGSEYGIDSGDEFATTVWNIFAVQDEALCNGSQVTLRSQPRPTVKKMQHEGTTGRKEDFEVPDLSHPEASLMVFRNQQGVFLPGMSDTEDIQTWRILKKGAEPGSRENIKEGDEVRLAWCFEDQHVGYRDFTDDVFGRRRTGPPPGMENTALFMKLPWPRFEPIVKQLDQKDPLPNALVMSPIPDSSTQPPMIDSIPTLVSQRRGPDQKKLYYMEDCTFRLDFVGNQGRGEVHDYLLRGVAQDKTDFSFRGNEREQEAEEMLARFLENRRQKSDRISMGLKLAAFGPFALSKRNPIASFLGF